MVRWRYQLLELDLASVSVVEELLDRLGAEGWEFAAQLPGGSLHFCRMLFKRPEAEK